MNGIQNCGSSGRFDVATSADKLRELFGAVRITRVNLKGANWNDGGSDVMNMTGVRSGAARVPLFSQQDFPTPWDGPFGRSNFGVPVGHRQVLGRGAPAER